MTTARFDCDYCGLPVAGGPLDDGPRYCCAGCRLAASITAAGGADGQARWLMTRLGLAAFFTMNVMVFTFLLWSQEAGGAAGSPAAAALYDLARYVCLLFSAPVLLLLGGPLLENAVAELRRARLSIDVLLLAGVAAAFGISAWNTWVGAGHVYFEVACMVLVAVTLGRWLEASGKLRTTEALRDLESLLPDHVRRLRSADGTLGSGEGRDVPLAAVAVGDVLRILPGEQVPTDGIIEAGRAALDERTVSGESEPVVRGPGEAVRSGTTNIDGDLAVVVTAPPGAGTLEQLIRAVTAAVRESGTQRLADRVAAWFLPAVLAVAAVAWGMHWWHSGLAAGVMAALAVVVVSCPCALGLATPLALWAALGRCMRRHVLVRDGDALERLAVVGTVCLDKTGTLTTGCRVAGMETLAGFDRARALALAAGLARGSSHQTAAAIAAFAAGESIDPAPVGDARSVAGLGVEGVLAGTGEVVRLGSPHWVTGTKGNCGVARPAARCLLAVGPDPVAAFWTAEEIRPRAAAAVTGLRTRGLALTILSGDQPERVAAVAETLGLSWRAPLLPAEKLAAIEALRRTGGGVMVGDGINDAAALAAADVGIALGCGADVARWTAPICLLDDDLESLPWLVDLARTTRRTIRWNLLWAFGYNAACIPLAATGIVHPAVAAAAMVVSSLLVVGNSLRLGRDDAAAGPPGSPARIADRRHPIPTEAGA
ncbi:MAG: heavy metal translocating P-type ATPase [Planctomycetota bacterium]